MIQENENMLCRKIDALADDVKTLAEKINTQSTALATIAEKVTHPCERVLAIENRVTRIETLRESKSEIIARWTVIAAVAISAMGLILSWLRH